MSSESNGAQDPAPAAAAATGNVVTSSAMQLFAPDPNAAGESVSFSCIFYSSNVPPNKFRTGETDLTPLSSLAAPAFASITVLRILRFHRLSYELILFPTS